MTRSKNSRRGARKGKAPFCFWCKNRHAGERRKNGKYCPGPLLEPNPSWVK